MRSVAARMMDARSSIMRATNAAMRENELPAYIVESIVADVLSDIRLASKMELQNEMEQEYGDLGKGIQQSNMAQQTVNGNTDQ